MVTDKTKEKINETLQIVDKQTYLGIEMTSSGRYTYTREILSKKATKVLSIIKRSLSNTDSATMAIKTKLLMLLLNPFYFMDAKFGDLNYYHTEHILVKVQLNKFTLSSVNKH